MYYLYILHSNDLNKFYIGSTQNIQERLQRHLSGRSKYTSKAKDWVLQYSVEYQTRALALKREKQLKNWKNAVRIRELIQQESEKNSPSV